MKTLIITCLLLVGLAGLALTWRQANAPGESVPASSNFAPPLASDSAEPIQAIPPPPALDPAKVALGEKLFREKRVSKDNTMSCNTCHQLDLAGADGLARSPQVSGELTPFHTPTIFNVSLNFQLFWDGRKKKLEEQIEAPRDMQTDWKEALVKLRGDPTYQTAFARAYPRQGMSALTLKDAIVTFERSLLTPGARFDRYLQGNQQAITEQEKHGYRLFKSYGCTACHQGVNVGGNMFQKMGVMQEHLHTHQTITPADLGRFSITQREEDRHVYRVPSLRNVAVTAPYFHDGSIATLHEAIREMAKYQLGRPIPKKDVDLIVAFLHTLTGEYRGKLLQGQP